MSFAATHEVVIICEQGKLGAILALGSRYGLEYLPGAGVRLERFDDGKLLQITLVVRVPVGQERGYFNELKNCGPYLKKTLLKGVF